MCGEDDWAAGETRPGEETTAGLPRAGEQGGGINTAIKYNKVSTVNRVMLTRN